jgi:hypothetical protein
VSRLALSLLVLLLAVTAAGAADRSRTLRAEFMRQQPCPTTGATCGPCPGWQVDHRIEHREIGMRCFFESVG